MLELGAFFLLLVGLTMYALCATAKAADRQAARVRRRRVRQGRLTVSIGERVRWQQRSRRR